MAFFQNMQNQYITTIFPSGLLIWEVAQSTEVRSYSTGGEILFDWRWDPIRLEVRSYSTGGEILFDWRWDPIRLEVRSYLGEMNILYAKWNLKIVGEKIAAENVARTPIKTSKEMEQKERRRKNKKEERRTKRKKEERRKKYKKEGRGKRKKEK